MCHTHMVIFYCKCLTGSIALKGRYCFLELNTGVIPDEAASYNYKRPRA